MNSTGDNPSSILQPGQSIKPNISLENAKKLVEDHYGVKVECTKELNSYDDKNFYIKGTTKDGKLAKLTFKILNSMDSKNPAHIIDEHVALQHLHENGTNCPVPLKNKEGDTFSIESFENNKNESSQSFHIIRLLSYVEVDIMHNVPTTPKLLQKAGKYIAEVEDLLKGLNLPSLDTRSSIWFLSNFLELRKFVYVIGNEEQKFSLVSEVLKAYKEKVIHVLPNLPKGIIHGDYNEQNIIVQRSVTDEGEYDVHGLIDFAELQKAPYVFELACICHLMLECVKDGLDPFEGAQNALKGYSSLRKLGTNELEVLRILVACRLCQSLVMGAYTYSKDPGNDYLLTTAKTGWKLLERVWREKSDEEIMIMWKHALSQ